MEGNNLNNENQVFEPTNYKAPPEPNGASSAVLVLGIITLAMVLMFACCGGGLVSIVCGIIALAIGIPKLIRNPKDQQVKVGIIFAAIGLFLTICIIALGVVMYTEGTLEKLFYEIDNSFV